MMEAFTMTASQTHLLLGRIFRAYAVCLATVSFALVAGYAGTAEAAPSEPPPCPNSGTLQANCTKEIRIFNNTEKKIYVVLQGVIQLTNAVDCPKTSPTTGGDVWLQAAFGDYSKCWAVTHDYYVYINPTTGIKKGEFASFSVPWWSKRPADAPDLYVDWWRGGRVYVFDDQTALNDSHSNFTKKDLATFAPGSPVVRCTAASGNACLPGELQIYQVTPEGKQNIAKHSPFQLNEFTFADVHPIDSSPDSAKFIDFNQGYNVSNVDQTYLPIAIEPVRQPADIGWIGSISKVADFRTILEAFTGITDNPTANWPIYNNPIVPATGRPMYPDAGIRVPSTFELLNFYMNPSTFPDGTTKEIIPATPPKLVQDLMNQWMACTAGTPVDCPDSAIYKEENKVFINSYQGYLEDCAGRIPPYLMPVDGTGLPSLVAFLRFVYGWVPFNVNCAQPDLPTADMPPAGSRAPVDYINVQYNYNIRVHSKRWFNPDVRFIHADPPVGLAATAYAFSIDDQASFVSNSGGELPGGLIIAVGGSKGLPNTDPLPPPLPPVYKYFSFTLGLGGATTDTTRWKSYALCGAEAVPFRLEPTDAYNLGVDPAVTKIPPKCTITLIDSKNNEYQLEVLKAAAVPPGPIWPFHCSPTPSKGCTGFDKHVVSCPGGASNTWCNSISEVTTPPAPNVSPVYSLSTPPPKQ
jgi:hypothetical protein